MVHKSQLEFEPFLVLLNWTVDKLLLQAAVDLGLDP